MDIVFDQIKGAVVNAALVNVIVKKYDSIYRLNSFVGGGDGRHGRFINWDCTRIWIRKNGAADWQEVNEHELITLFDNEMLDVAPIKN